MAYTIANFANNQQKSNKNKFSHTEILLQVEEQEAPHHFPMSLQENRPRVQHHGCLYEDLLEAYKQQRDQGKAQDLLPKTGLL